jgi:uncharacterized membrane protein
VLLEAHGPSYQDFARMSMLTGLPIPLGWEYHVKQRGHDGAEIEARRDAIRTIYTTPDAGEADALLRRLRVSFVYDGWLERQTYPAEGLAKFRERADLFELVYENDDARIYRVRAIAVDGASP